MLVLHLMVNRKSLLSLIVMAVSTTALANTSDQSENKAIYYSNAHIQQMQGQSALDIIRQIPGFRFVDSSDQRGLNNAAGNVLISGLPVLNKTQSLSDLLLGISVDNIQTMEVYLTGHPFSSVTQHTQVVNLVRNHDSKAINWRLSSLSHAGDAQPSRFSLQTGMKWLGWEHQVQVRGENTFFHSISHFNTSAFNTSAPHAPDSLATIFQNGDEQYKEQSQQTNLNLTSSKTLPTSSIQWNTQASTLRFDETYSRQWANQNKGQGSTFIQAEEDLEQLELGFDWREKTSEKTPDWSWTITGLMRRENTDSQSTTRLTEGEDSTNNNVSFEYFEQEKTLTEQVIQIARQHTGVWWQPEVGTELSRNRLEADTVEQDLASTSVQETRIEPFIASQMTLSERWRLYTRLTIEHSSLNSQASRNNEVHNQYLKPLVRLSYQPDSGLTSTLTFKRQIKQLDFDDFIASQDVNVGRSQSGNTQLQPEQRLELSYGINYESNTDWSISTRLLWQERKNIHEFMMLDASTQGIGNAGDASRYGALVNLTVPIHRVIENGQIAVEYEYSDSHFNDPIFGKRPISGVIPHTGNLALRVDRDHYAWGAYFYLPEVETIYYPDEVYREKINAFINLFAEVKISKGITLDIRLNDALGGRYVYERDFYTPNRNSSIDSRFISRERNDPILYLSLNSRL